MRAAGLEKCQPAEEGQPYQLSYTLTTIPAYRTMLLWLKDGQLVSECPVEAGECSNNDISWLYARVEKRNNGVEFILDIQNVTRENEKNVQGVWTLKTHSMEPTSQEMYSCALQVYAKAVDISCVSDVVTKGVTISCSTSRIYPEAMVSIKSERQEISDK
ncbi:uncharacterized protein LOC131939405 [Physella acuta]|uniref:uncharacterized protein LOC131939405 n=1 Tax=Physella acuta TaxID=109671 RepID=UPI0027DC39EC|nr:uncharacterized protein LOC131939405 [Physella acuta]